MLNQIVMELSRSSEPSLRYKINVHVFGKSPRSKIVTRTQQDVRRSDRVAALLDGRDEDGRLPDPPGARWTGAHWVLASLADQGYPPGDDSLAPLREQVHEWLFATEYLDAIPTIEGRVRAAASREGAALHTMLVLGLADARSDALATRLLDWQWPDGGWSDDPDPAATHSSFDQTLAPLRAMVLYNTVTGDPRARTAANRAAEVLLSRGLIKNGDGSSMPDESLRLHAPPHDGYDLLAGLKALTEGGFLEDPRCGEALDRLEGLVLEGGGFAAVGPATEPDPEGGASPVDWGPTGPEAMNPFVTADALQVLHEAGRL